MHATFEPQSYLYSKLVSVKEFLEKCKAKPDSICARFVEISSLC
jgi:hypothetical protein